MPEQAYLPTLDGPVLATGPVFVCFEIRGKPGHKARHRSRTVIPTDAWTFIPGYGPAILKKDVGKIFMHNYPDPDTAAYEKIVALAGRRFMGSRAPTTNPVALLVHVFRAVPVSWSKRAKRLALLGGILPTTKPDWDNHGKITDGLNGIVWHDDSQVADSRVIKRYSDEPGLRIEVREFVVDQVTAR